MKDDLEQLLKNLHLSRMAEILDQELAEAGKEQPSYDEFLARLLRAQWHHRQESALAYRNIKPEQTNIFFKLMEERYNRLPTIITTNLDFPEWQNFLGNPGLVEALLSRLRHRCKTVRINGISLRDPQG